ncbi:MAG: energy-coupled thiamine transporter ThiT [Bacilli bacterium]|nr:energy-coupled thiamine transporter ThiT [Bacilli bacterium]
MTTKKIVGTAVLSALTIVLTLISNYITVGGTISINLALLPIAIAAIMYGPWSAMLVGMINGGFIILAPSTQAIFMPISPVGTIVVCLLKTGLAGLAAGFIYKAFKKHETVGMIVSSLAIPVINTGLFLLGSYIFFKGGFGNFIDLFITVNFAIEFVVTAILSPTTVRVVNLSRIRTSN